MSRGVGSVSEYATSVVRVFSGWAESVIWFSGPIAYEDTRLEPDLVADLRAWDDTYHDGPTSDGRWPHPDLAVRHDRAGARLARRVAEQIGDDFEVQHDLGEAHRRVRAAGPARNRAAASAFRKMAEHAWAERAQLRDVVESGAILCWSAGRPTTPPSPVSGTAATTAPARP